MERRTFLKITGMGGIGFAAGCSSDPERILYTLVKAPEDMVTGRSSWYATTCRECPAGCGVLAENREGRAIKLEGNPLHPVNEGKLCARGQAALQGLYNPDGIETPLLKSDGGWQTIDFPEATALIRERMGRAASKGPGRIGMVTEVVGDTLLRLFNAVLNEYGAKDSLIYEPFGFESLKFAHSRLFKAPVLPGIRMDKCDLLIGFGADFLETWLSPVEYARKFKTMHAVADGVKGRFFQISPYQSLTAANADRWLACRPGSEPAVAMMLIRNALDEGRGEGLETPFRGTLLQLVRPYTVARTAQLSDLPEAALEKLARHMVTAKRPLVLGSGTASDGAPAAAVDLASALLNVILDPSLSRYDFEQRHRVEIASPRSALAALAESTAQGGLDLILLNNVNPVYTLPANGGMAEALTRKETFVVAFTHVMDETAALADLVFPTRTALASWDVYESKQGIKATLQPVLGQITSAPGVGDLFLKLMPARRKPADSYRNHVIQQLSGEEKIGSAKQWGRLFQTGGRFGTAPVAAKPSVNMGVELVETLAGLVSRASKATAGQPVAYLSPSLRYWDGRGANRSWLSEIPDPVSQVAWQSLAWVHPETMAANGWSEGDTLRIASDFGRIEVQAVSYGGLHPDAVVLPLGQGHTHYGRYAENQGANPVSLLGAAVDPLSGAPNYTVAIKKITGAGTKAPLAVVSGSRVQYERKIALSVPLADAAYPDELGKGLAMNDFPFTLPLPEGYDRRRDIYPSHGHDTYRWGMVVDLDRCIGCSACVAACYAENNVGVVGESQVAKGREMAWIRIERYEDPDDPTRQIYFPMMCQHCDNGPCEAVCPVYAPHHSKEGLNNQIYNRCIGTRFCGQNCPYKVRRFNWLEWQWPDPLPMQLNPNVTVRSKGVMEKCSFCIQRIKAAHGLAKDENRTIRDGEVIPACVQTCPTNALYFGNLMDPRSIVRKRISDPRAYQALGYLNTKPAVIYLKKVVQTL
ncbi:MAG: 4Fe-4S dicluster domain-containing protein [Desulfobacteraceae bacterium]|jgi:molybdopterin-containing oxidoreductase family iron-sulfur binding subunit